MEEINVSNSTGRVFYEVGGKHQRRMDVLTKIFNDVLTPLYGSQKNAIKQIRQSKDRKCFLLYDEGDPAGVLAFKSRPSEEFAQFGVPQSIEVKSLFVYQPEKNSGRGLGSALVDKLKEEVEKLGVDYDSVHLTVSEQKVESFLFFSKKGFAMKHFWKGRYQKGVTEFLLVCPRSAVQTGLAENASGPKVQTFARTPRDANKDEQVPELVHVIHDAHFDDIHCLRKLSDGTVVSASKDNCVIKWDPQGNLVKMVADVEPVQQNERRWITALEVLNDEYFVSGGRNGEVVLWTTGGRHVKSIRTIVPKGHKSLPLNRRRITCLAAGLNRQIPSVYIGAPTMFSRFNFIEGRIDRVNKAHRNDWVYCIEPLAENRLLTAVGPTIDVWERSNLQWKKERVLDEQERYEVVVGKKKYTQRSFIADVCAIGKGTGAFGLANFNGSVQILDLAQKKLISRWDEHQGRVWKVEAINNHLVASGSEDQTVKIWDMRCKESVHTIDIQDGQVTSLLAFDETTLLTGTCPESRSPKKSAQIRFYDMRK